MNPQEIEALERKIALSIDAAGWFDDFPDYSDVIFSALLQIGFRRALVRGASPHQIARAFHSQLVGLLAEGADKPRKYRPHLVEGDE